MSPRSVKMRIDKLREYARELTDYKPSYRIEVSVSLPPSNESFLDGVNNPDMHTDALRAEETQHTVMADDPGANFEATFAPVAATILVVWNNLVFLHLPMSLVRQSMGRVVDFVMDTNRLRGVPCHITPFTGRNNNRLTWQQREFGQLTFNMLGISCSKALRLFYANFANR